MTRDNEYYHTYPIKGIDNDSLQYVDLVDDEACRSKFFVVSRNGDTTPIFDNEPNFIVLNKNSCLFIGSYRGVSNLYYAQGPVNNEEMYWELETSVEPISMTDFDDTHVIVKAREGVFLFNTALLEQSSDVFDKIMTEEIEGEKHITFEKKYTYKDVSKTITGVLTSEGKIGNFMYDDLDFCMKIIPKISGAQEYDRLDDDKLNASVETYYNKKNEEKKERVKQLIRVNKHRKND